MSTTPGFSTLVTKAWDKTYVRQAALVASLLIAIGVTQVELFNWTTRTASPWIASLDLHPSLCTNTANCFVPAVGITDWERNRIDAQYQQIGGRAKHHFDVMINLYSNYYVFIVMAALTGVAAGIAIFLVGRTGWAAASTSGLVIVIAMTSAALLYRSLPAVFKQEENIAENKRLYLAYVALENETRSFAATGEDVQGVKQTAGQFIHHLDERMSVLDNIALGFDPSKVPAVQEIGSPREIGPPKTEGRDQK